MGNSHMLMMDKYNPAAANVILAWLQMTGVWKVHHHRPGNQPVPA